MNNIKSSMNTVMSCTRHYSPTLPPFLMGKNARKTTSSIMAEPTSSSTSSRIWSIEDILRREPEEPQKSAV